jgi:hypothetical protein
MKTWVRKTLSVGVLAAGALLFGPAAAHADSHQINGGNTGILNGTQLVTGVQVPVNVVGNSAGILGEANSFGTGVNRVEGTHGGQSNGDNNGIANGTQIFAPISVPINACGNSIALLGGASSQALCGNDVFGGTRVHRVRHHRESAKVTESAWQSNGDNNGILNGTQLYAPISLPVNLSGNSVAALGEADSRAVSGNRTESAQGGWGDQSNGDNNGFLNRTQIAAPISIPINLCGNALGILGGASSAAACGNDVFGGDDVWIDGDGHRHHGGKRHGGHGGHGVLRGDNGTKGGHKGHGQNAGDKDGQYAGDNGTTPDTNSYGDDNGTEPASGGYGDDNGTEPAIAPDNAGYQDTKADNGKYGDKATRGKSKSIESLPVANPSDDSGLGGLGLLTTTLR